MKNRIMWIVPIMTAMIAIFPVSALAIESGDIAIGGIELDKLLNLGTAILATILCILTIIAYRRKNSKRLLYVGIAFLIFAIKGFLMSVEIFLGDLKWIDPVANVLDFAMLLSFFLGIIKK